MPMNVAYTNFGGQLIHENRGGTESFFTADPLGSIVDVRNSSGTQTFSATYWPYGEIRTSTGTNPSQFDFVGALGYYRENSARTYVRARFLRKELARWMTVDPLWPGQAAFKYGQLAPNSFSDPSGLWCFGESGGPLPGVESKFGKPPGLGVLNLLLTDPAAWQAFLDCLSTCARQFPQNLGPIEDVLGGFPSNAGGNCKHDFEIIWAEGGWWPFTNMCNDEAICMWTDIRARPPKIHICQKQAMIESKCGPMHCQLAHELIHVLGIIHTKDPAAFRCVNLLPGCANYSPVNTGHAKKK